MVEITYRLSMAKMKWDSIIELVGRVFGDKYREKEKRRLIIICNLSL